MNIIGAIPVKYGLLVFAFIAVVLSYMISPWKVLVSIAISLVSTAIITGGLLLWVRWSRTKTLV